MARNIDRMRDAAAQGRPAKPKLKYPTVPEIGRRLAGAKPVPPAAKTAKKRPQKPKARDAEMNLFRFPPGTSFFATWDGEKWLGVLVVDEPHVSADALKTMEMVNMPYSSAPGVHQLLSELGRAWYATQQKVVANDTIVDEPKPEA